ncbi:GSCOCG00007297001-RA-CDS [Cotesia congregata]|nr:GSCOCG00007297001-RA-CDS [Cotesia congregata]
MHLHFEKNNNAKCDCNILSLSWMGKVPDEEVPEVTDRHNSERLVDVVIKYVVSKLASLKDTEEYKALEESYPALFLADEGWKLNRANYYQEGWLATGNARGLVGVTFTTSHCRTRITENPLRANYNLRGHQSEVRNIISHEKISTKLKKNMSLIVILVKWNEPYQKLASCDSSGVIFVWIKYEGRWSIELINDRSTPVTHFSWSHDGRMALICYRVSFRVKNPINNTIINYRDGFVLVGSVGGQRYWSSMLNDQATITCGIWTPDDLQVYFGTTSGQLIVMDVHGAMVSEVQLSAGITSMAWSAQKFRMEEGDLEDDDICGVQTQPDERTYVLAVCLTDGNIVMLRSYDDLSPITIKTGLKAPLFAEWSNSRELLAIAGTKESETSIANPPEYNNLLKFYSFTGTLIYTTTIPYTQGQVSALTWGHNDWRLFIATGAKVHAAWVSRNVGSLQLLATLAVRAALTRESSVQQLPLPRRLRAPVAALFASTIRSCVPEPRELRKFVSRPPPGGGRLHCTMLRHAGEPAPCYTLYLEYLGGLVPLLKGRRTSKIRPEFVIFDPQSQDTLQIPDYSFPSFSDSSDTERDTAELCGSPRNRRKNRRKKDDKSNDESDVLTYIDTLPEDGRLVEVTSNIWGTKFKIHGLTDSVPANLGQVTYRTSLLHLQPRQMTLVITELRDDLPAGPDPSFNPNLFSEDEEETFSEPQGASRPVDIPAPPAPPIAPMTSRGTRLNPAPRPKSQLSSQSQFISNPEVPPENFPFDEDFPYVANHFHHQNMLDFCENLRATSSNYRSSRHQPRCCDVPALQSPKNAVAPTQTLIATSNSSSDYSGNIQRVKTSLISEQSSIRKELEINKINQLDDKNVAASLPTSRCQTNGGSTSPIYVNFSASNGSFVHTKPSSHQKGKNLRTSGAQNGKTEREELRFIDEEAVAKEPELRSVHRTPTVVSIGPINPVLDPMVRSCSVGYLDLVDAQMVPCEVALKMLRKEAPNKRLVLVSRKTKRRKKKAQEGQARPRLRTCGKSRSLDSSDMFPSTEQILPVKLLEHVEEIEKREELGTSKEEDKREEKVLKETGDTKSSDSLSSSLDGLAARLRDFDDTNSLPPPSPRPNIRLPRSSPSSPAPTKKGKRPASASPIRRRLLSSPLLNRRTRKNRGESSDDEGPQDDSSSRSYRNLETFQKAQLRQKVILKHRGNGVLANKPEELVMHNKAPMWNESSQVYQLDFGGRVTQESAKNFQIEYRGKQVMQFGRIDGNAYTLDFQYPFSALQAFAVALANVTQRLK